MSPKERQLAVDDSELLVVDSMRRGSPPVVAVHGFPGADHMTLRQTAGFEHLEQRTRVIYYDQRGSGHSSALTGAEDGLLATHGADLRAVIAGLGLERPIVVAHDTGGCVGLAFALEHPAELSGLVLVCGRPATGIEERRRFEKLVADYLEVEDVGDLFAPGSTDPDVVFTKAMQQVFPLSFLRFGLTERTFMERITFRYQAYESLWRAVEGCDLGERLGDVRVPCLVMAGRHDPFVDLGRSRAMADAIPVARFVMFHNSAHWPFHEEPQEFADMTWEWVEQVAAHIL